MLTKEWIDAASYEQLLTLWRHNPNKEIEIFQGEKGQYLADKMAEKRDALAPGYAIMISKRVGW